MFGVKAAAQRLAGQLEPPRFPDPNPRAARGTRYQSPHRTTGNPIAASKKRDNETEPVLTSSKWVATKASHAIVAINNNPRSVRFPFICPLQRQSARDRYLATPKSW